MKQIKRKKHIPFKFGLKSKTAAKIVAALISIVEFIGFVDFLLFKSRKEDIRAV